jgi:hypothetical protein
MLSWEEISELFINEKIKINELSNYDLIRYMLFCQVQIQVFNIFDKDINNVDTILPYNRKKFDKNEFSMLLIAESAKYAHNEINNKIKNELINRKVNKTLTLTECNELIHTATDDYDLCTEKLFGNN